MRRLSVLFLLVATPCFADDRWDRWGDRNREGAGRYNSSLLPQNVTIDKGFQLPARDNTPTYGERKNLAKQEEDAALTRTLILAGAVVAGAAVLGLILKGRKHEHAMDHPRGVDQVPQGGRGPNQGVGDQGGCSPPPIPGSSANPKDGDS